MNAKVVALNHYTQVEEIARARQTIEQLRYALHDTIAQLASLSAAISIERVKCVDVMDQAHAVLLSTLPGGVDLDALPKSERAAELRSVMLDICGMKP